MGHDLPGRFKITMERMQYVIRSLGLEEKLRIDEDRLGRAIIDYFEDIDRLKDFEEIDRVNVAKIYSHSIYWLLRRSPVIVNEPVPHDERMLFINEIICASMLLMLMCAEAGESPEMGDERTKRYYHLVYYNFKYRQYSQHSLELAVESFLFGHSVGRK